MSEDKNDGLQVPRQAQRKKAAIYIFLNDRIEILRELIQNGLKFEYDVL